MAFLKDFWARIFKIVVFSLQIRKIQFFLDYDVITKVIVTSNEGLLVLFWCQWKEEAHTIL